MSLRLVERIGERHAARLEACRVDVRDVVADDIHARLMRLESRDAREQRTGHEKTSPSISRRWSASVVRRSRASKWSGTTCAC